jgi:hypothetical protein
MLAIIQSKIFCLPVSYKKLNIEVYKTVILPVVLYGCETWSLTLGEEHRLRVFRVIKSRRMGWAGHVARMREGRSVYRVLVGKPEGKRPLAKPRRRCEDNIKMDLREIGINGANCIQLAQDRVQWRACVNTRNEPSGSIRKQDIF